MAHVGRTQYSHEGNDLQDLFGQSSGLISRGNEVAAVEHGTGGILAEFTIDPDRGYQPEKQKPPVGRSEVLPMTRLIREGCVDSPHSWS
jgi:hypothetical protein